MSAVEMVFGLFRHAFSASDVSSLGSADAAKADVAVAAQMHETRSSGAIHRPGS
ncbi:hypothetical protein PAMC26510_07995 [Caballeronia sordidicola]|uniref:Uncharacterized protein n=1 Tax=Caballeronia sordidicola TaxID=196367 RepID=A0A242N3U7_CABSO|nr:hypothetical protein PAMC26510_07995 [Caballeronia sordidicola]